MRLHDLAHARAGDKGDTSDISVIARRPEDYPLLREVVTAERVREHFADIVAGSVDRYEVPQLYALISADQFPSAFFGGAGGRGAIGTPSSISARTSPPEASP